VRRPDPEALNLPPPRRQFMNKCSYTCVPPIGLHDLHRRKLNIESCNA